MVSYTKRKHYPLTRRDTPTETLASHPEKWYNTPVDYSIRKSTKVTIAAGISVTLLVLGHTTGIKSDQTLTANPQPTPTATPTPSAGAGNKPPRLTPLSPKKLKRLLGNVGFTGDSQRTAWAIVMRESRAIPGIVGAMNSNGTRDYGLFQINDVHRSYVDFTKILAPKYNARTAYTMSSQGTDFGAWGVGTTGWAGHLKKNYPVTWQQLQDALTPWYSQYDRLP